MEGETAVLECMSLRGGKPRLEWIKDGRPVTTSSRHYFAADGQLLVIVKAQSIDSGDYTCVMTNSLGSERATSRLEVVRTNYVKSVENPVGQDSDDMTRIGIIVIAVVVCVVGTSLVWVIIIYRLRLKREEFGSTTTDDTILGSADLLGSPFHTADDMSYAGKPVQLLAGKFIIIFKQQ